MKKQPRSLINLGKHRPADCSVGVIGLGLMGASIVACLLAAGHVVIGIEKDSARRRAVKRRVLHNLKRLIREKILRADPDALIRRLSVSDSLADLAGTAVVIESITENLESKVEVLLQVEAVVSPATLIGSNTSAIPITELQKRLAYPGRVLGMHWDEPAEVTVFMEIVQGELTSPAFFKLATEIAGRWWGKQPAQVLKDCKGFITNRISYAMYREACHMVDSGMATMEDIDRSLRNDVGWWMAFAGPFRYMDLMGVRAYETVMRDLLPDLSCGTGVPAAIRKATRRGANGISTGRGFYRYSPAQAKRWEKRYHEFAYEMRRLTAKYGMTE